MGEDYIGMKIKFHQLQIFAILNIHCCKYSKIITILMYFKSSQTQLLIKVNFPQCNLAETQEKKNIFICIHYENLIFQILKFFCNKMFVNDVSWAFTILRLLYLDWWSTSFLSWTSLTKYLKSHLFSPWNFPFK